MIECYVCAALATFAVWTGEDTKENICCSCLAVALDDIAPRSLRVVAA